MIIQSSTAATMYSAATKNTHTAERQSVTADTATYADQATISPAARAKAAAESQGVGPYDFTNMTPKQMRGVADELYQAGKIDLTQLFMLQNAGTIGRVGANGEFIPLSPDEKARQDNTPMNYIQIAKDAIRFLEHTGNINDPTSSYPQWKGILETLQNA